MPHYPYMHFIVQKRQLQIQVYCLFLRTNDFDDATSFNDQISLLPMYL